jgi:tripartite-type tricarboxylate transporter receptor subunit TctC
MNTRFGGGPAIYFLLLVSCLFAAEAWSQAYPARPIRYIIPSSAGSGNDFIARIMAVEMSYMLGQQIVVDNRAGGGGNIAGDLAAHAPADGYTMFQTSITLAINASLYRNLPYDIVRDFAPVTLLAIQPNLVVINASVPAKSIDEFIRLAKTRPGEFNYSSAGLGSNSFLAAELLNTLAGIKLTHVPYKGGGPAVAAVAAGETSLMIGPIPTAMPFIQQGKMRGLAVSSSQRLAAFPQYPTVDESLPGFVFDNWYGLMVPARTPKAVITVLHRSAVETLNKPNIVKQLSNVGYIATTNQPAEFGAFLKTEIAKLDKIIKQTGARAD